jgi:CRP/FNR family transcriptional regulator, cyclic AMP receptor protein
MFTHAHPGEFIDLLGTLSLFTGLSRRELQKIAGRCTLLERPAGRVLCEEGQPGRECFVIVDGEVTVRTGSTAVATLGPGSVFGEIALLDDGLRTATVVTDTDVQILVFNRREFEAILADAPRVARRILATLGARLRHADRHLKRANA